MSLFISDAFADAATAAAQPHQGDGMYSMFMVAVIFILMYFMLIRPQNKRAKDHREMVNKLQKGDEIITNGGLLGKVSQLDEQYVKVSIAEGVEVTLQRGAVTHVLPKGTLKTLLSS